MLTGTAKKSRPSGSAKKRVTRIEEIHALLIRMSVTDPDQAENLVQEAIELATAAGNISLLLKSYVWQALVLRHRMKAETGLELLYRALEMAEEHGLPAITAVICCEIGSTLYWLGRYGQARDIYMRALELFSALADYQGQVRELSNLANIATIGGDMAEAMKFCQQALAICEEQELKIPYFLLHNTANIYSHAGEVQKALEYYFMALEDVRQNDRLSAQATTLACISSIHFNNNEPEHSLQFLQQALGIHEHLDSPGEKLFILTRLADTLIELARPDEADSYLRAALGLLEGKRFPERELLFYRVSARLQREKGNQPEALRLLDRALVLSVESNDPRNKATILLEKGKTASGEEREQALLQALETALAIGRKNILPDIYYALYEHCEQKGELLRALEYHKSFHAAKQEIQSEESVRRFRIMQVLHDAEKARKEAELLRLRNEKLEEDAARNRTKLDELTSDLLQKNQMLYQIRQNGVNALMKHGLSQKKMIREIIQISEEGSHSLWREFEERSRLVQGNPTEKILKICPELTATELRVTLLLKTGLSNKEIARMLSVEERTVEYHRSAIRKKLKLERMHNMVSYLNSI